MNGWTDADGAELDVLLFELVRCYFEHRERCPVCAARALAHGLGEHCPALKTAIETALEWREARELLSRAEFLRAERNLLEEAHRGR